MKQIPNHTVIHTIQYARIPNHTVLYKYTIPNFTIPVYNTIPYRTSVGQLISFVFMFLDLKRFFLKGL